VTLDLSLPVPALLSRLAPEIDRRIERMLPKAYDAAALARTFGGQAAEYDARSVTQTLAAPLWHYLEAGGKRWRPGFMLVAGAALGVAPERLLDLAAMCEMIHNATLLVDDIEDDSPKRRGRDAAHVAFGVDVAVNAGNGLYFIPLAAVANDRLDPAARLRIHGIVADEMVKLHFGQAMDIAWHRGDAIPSEAQYLRMCAFKTGTLARMAARVAAAVAAAPQDVEAALGAYAESIGVAFQIQDDILNVSPSALAEGKGFGDDIHEGKKSLLVIHAAGALPKEKAARLLALVASRPSDRASIEEAVALLAESAAFQHGRAKARELVQSAWARLAPSLPANPGADKLREFGEFVVEREK